MRITDAAGPRLRHSLLALTPVCVAFLVQWVMWPVIQPFAWFLFSPAVFFSAWVGGRRIGILASLLATLIVWYFFMPPENSFIVVQPAREVIAALTFFGTGVIFSLFHDRLKRVERSVAEGVAASRFKAQMESVFQAIQEGIVVTDMKGSFLMVNEAEARMNGFPSPEAMKQDIAFYKDRYVLSLPGGGKPLPLEEWPVSRVLNGESIKNMELRVQRRDAGLDSIFSLSAEPVLDEDGKQILAVIGTRDITEQKESEEKLHDSEERLRLALSGAGLGVFEWNVSDDRAVWENDRMYEMFGLTPADGPLSKADLVGRYVLPDDVSSFDQALADGMKSGSPFHTVYRIRRKDGTLRWLDLSANFEGSREGVQLRMIGVLADITERKQAEEEVRESASRFRQLAESLPQLVWTCRPDGSCDYTSPQWVAYTGIPEDQQLQFGWMDQVHPDDRAPVISAWNQTIGMNSSPFEIELRARRHDGVYRWFKTMAVALRNSDGEIIKWFGSNTDIDNEKQTEQALRESKDRLAAIVSTAMDGIITVDEDQHVILFNEAAERMFGCPASAAIGQPLAHFIPERLHHNKRAIGTMGRPYTLTARRADGTEFPIEAAMSSLEVGGRKLYTIIHRDITERKQAEAEREQLALEQARRAAAETANRSKDEFLALVSHELRSPLSAILGYTRMLRSRPDDRNTIYKATAVIERSVRTQIQIIEDLLDSARIVTGKLRIEPRLIDLVPVLESAVDSIRSSADAKGIVLVTDFGPLAIETFGDPARLQQVVSNLLTNAVKFTPHGGRIELHMESADDNVRIIVRDTGIGIEPDFLPFVFDRFRQADPASARRFAGLGLGLSIVKHIVDLHGGTISAVSEGAGRGSTFTVTLRHHPELVAPAISAPEARRHVRTRRR